MHSWSTQLLCVLMWRTHSFDFTRKREIYIGPISTDVSLLTAFSFKSRAAALNNMRRKVEGVMNEWLFQRYGMWPCDGRILWEFKDKICWVLLSVITKMTSSWEHMGTERLWVTGEEMGCLTPPCEQQGRFLNAGTVSYATEAFKTDVFIL